MVGSLIRCLIAWPQCPGPLEFTVQHQSVTVAKMFPLYLQSRWVTYDLTQELHTARLWIYFEVLDYAYIVFLQWCKNSGALVLQLSLRWRQILCIILMSFISYGQWCTADFFLAVARWGPPLWLKGAHQNQKAVGWKDGNTYCIFLVLK